MRSLNGAMFSVDTSELRELAADLRQLPERMNPEVRKVVEKGAVNIKKTLRDEAKGSRHFRLERHISYDMREGGFGDQGVYEAEIGPESLRAGNLANIAYFGGSNGGGGTLPDPQLAGDKEAPAFESSLADLIDKAILG